MYVWPWTREEASKTATRQTNPQRDRFAICGKGYSKKAKCVQLRECWTIGAGGAKYPQYQRDDEHQCI